MSKDSELRFPDDAVPKLSEGLLQLYEPGLKVVKGQLFELTKKQEVVCRQLHEENMKLAAAQYSTDLEEMFTKIRIYRDKLIIVKKKMILMHDRSTKLKKRVLKLEQNKQNEAKQRAQQREKEEQLIETTQPH